MKHIFKKLHHHPNRSNEIPQSTAPPQSPPPAASDNRASPSTTTPSAAATSTSSDASNNNNNKNSNNNNTGTSNRQQQQDYYASEEEYQVQLALALSVSSSDRNPAPDNDPTRSSLFRSDDLDLAAADLLSRHYWVSSVFLPFTPFCAIIFSIWCTTICGFVLNTSPLLYSTRLKQNNWNGFCSKYANSNYVFCVV